MKLRLERITANDEATLGILYMNNRFVAFTLEDQHQDEKVAGETRISAGEYKLGLRERSPLADRYRSRFGDWHKGMLWIHDVPNFEWIYIHVGNTDDHTDGCILVGNGATARDELTVQHSVEAYTAIAKEIFAAMESGDEVSIEIIERGSA